MTAKEPTPWGTYLVLGAAIALAWYLNKYHDWSIYEWADWIKNNTSPDWWSGVLIIGGTFAICLTLLLPLAFLTKFKWYRVHFRNLTPGGWLRETYSFLVCGYTGISLIYGIILFMSGLFG